MKVLGIDYGTKKCGLAVADTELGMAFARNVLPRKDNESLLLYLAEMIEAENIKEVVMGLPVDMQGEETLITRQAKNFGNKLAARLQLPVHFHDERLTSVEAQERLREAGFSAKKAKKNLDAEAAAIILRSYLGL
ncbi:MAG: Holliday junction resolvase RuvX [Desulfovibrio sp.]|uniref:Holliday junction resolvase RuvX n=1 Tax=Desulfovibrio sp. 7SRBS1 TaxID=3378064 RepID=UPI003B3E5FB8